MKIKYEIKNRFSGEVQVTVQITCEKTSSEGVKLGLAVRAAIVAKANLSYADLSSANLRYADLSSANLSYADLSSANLRYANLSSANLRYANLSSANLRYANLSYANLSSADLSSANLSYANLSYANLSYANLSSADLPSPTILLLANWAGSLTEQLTADLMEYDAAAHPDRSMFDVWASGGPCPYEKVKIQRAANFTENKKLWGSGTLRGSFDLMMSLFAEREIKR